MRGLLLASVLLLLAPSPLRAQDALPPLQSRVTDTTGTLDAAAIQRIDAPLAELEARKGSQVAVLMIPSTGDESIEAYALRAFETWRIGREGVDDGVLLVVARDDRTVRIEVGYGLEGAIPDVTAHRVIQEYLVPAFRAGDFGGGIEAATLALAKLVDGEALPEPMASHPVSDGPGPETMTVLLVTLVVANAVRGMLRSAAAVTRGAVVGGVAATVSKLLLGAPWWLVAVIAVLGFLFGLAKVTAGRNRTWSSGSGSSGGGWSGGGWSGGGGSSGGWSGGGGSSGGGGASGRW